MVPSRNGPKGAEVASFGLAILVFFLTPTQVGYQDLAALMVQQPAVVYAPAPVVYPAPVYVRPVYAPPVVTFGFRFGGGHGHYHRHW